MRGTRDVTVCGVSHAACGMLKMLAHLYERLQDWEQMRALLPELRKRKVLSVEAPMR